MSREVPDREEHDRDHAHPSPKIVMATIMTVRPKMRTSTAKIVRFVARTHNRLVIGTTVSPEDRPRTCRDVNDWAAPVFRNDNRAVDES
jgi:hypothetical protein